MSAFASLIFSSRINAELLFAPSSLRPVWGWGMQRGKEENSLPAGRRRPIEIVGRYCFMTSNHLTLNQRLTKNERWLLLRNQITPQHQILTQHFSEVFNSANQSQPPDS